MSKESTNVELKDLEVHGGTFVSDPERGKTEIPPKGAGEKTSQVAEPGMIEIALAGKGYNNEIKAKANGDVKETEGFEVGD